MAQSLNSSVMKSDEKGDELATPLLDLDKTGQDESYQNDLSKEIDIKDDLRLPAPNVRSASQL